MAGTPAPILFCPDRPFIVRAEVEQEFVRRLKVGQVARVEDESGGRQVLVRRVARIAGWYSSRRATNDKPSAFKDVPTVECLIQLDDRRPPLRIGQRVQVTDWRISQLDFVWTTAVILQVIGAKPFTIDDTVFV